MIDAVLSYHLNPNTCGVAKFNHVLARRLGVPVLPLTERTTHPLVSIKPSEMSHPADCHWRTYDLLLHDRTLTPEAVVIQNARRVLYADEIGCPSTLTGDASRGGYRVLVFGMAHKLVLPHFEKLKAQLDARYPDYTIELSTAVHEGSPWDATLTESVDAMRRIFGNRLRVLGYLGDDALAKELTEVDAVAVFYEPALRANNTTAWAALATGKPLYTNTDGGSPPINVASVTWDTVLESICA